MMAAGQAHAVRDGIANVVFQHGAAERLPFLDNSFDLVVTRFSLHHMIDPDLAVADMARCLRPGGRMLVADLLASPDPALAAAQDRLETLRDPSHTHSLNRAQLEAVLGTHGLVDVSIEERDLHTPLKRWLTQSQTPDDIARSIEIELRAELSGDAAPTGFQPFDLDGELHFVQRLGSALAFSPGSSSAGRPPTDR
jgi:SAM-dependent methyltransferase